MTETCVPISKWARMVKNIAGNKCVICGSTNKLESHHVIPKSLHPELANDLNNGLCLCHECHLAYHGGRYYTKHNIGSPGESYYRESTQRHAMVKDFNENCAYIVYPAKLRLKERIQEAAAKQGISVDEWIYETVETALRKIGK